MTDLTMAMIGVDIGLAICLGVVLYLLRHDIKKHGR